MTRFGILVACVLLVAGCGGKASPRSGAPRLSIQPGEPTPRPVGWKVTHPARLPVPTRTYRIPLGPGYTVAVLDVVTDADGDGRPDLLVEGTRSRGAARKPEYVFVYSHASLRPGPLARVVASGAARVAAAIGPDITYRGAATNGSPAGDVNGDGLSYDQIDLEADRAETSYPCGGEALCGSWYEALRVTVTYEGGGTDSAGEGWRKVQPRPPSYPAGAVWGVGDWNDDGRADLLEGGMGIVRVLAFTRDGARALPLPQIDGPEGLSHAFPVAADLTGDGKSEVAGLAAGTDGVSLVIVSPV
jgi:hypothetical protein